MVDESVAGRKKLSWKFPPTFWFANGAELCERAAYYGMFITLYRYLNQDVGFTDRQTGLITALFAGGIYLFPTFMGIMADKVGFRRALLLAFSLLMGGYALLGVLQLKVTSVVALTLIMLGGAIIKPVISGTVAKCSDSLHRARAMSVFYMVVNIGSFSGKGLAGVLNEKLGLQYINFYAAGMSFVALLLVFFWYRDIDTVGTGKTVKEALEGLWKVMRHFRFLSLILIIAGFWLIQGQLYGAMPTYVERVLGKGYKPEWLANINPLTVVILVVLITQLVRNFKPENAIGIGLFIIPFTALVIALNPVLESLVGNSIVLPSLSMSPGLFWTVAAVLVAGLTALFVFALKRGQGVPVGAVFLVLIGVLIAFHVTGQAPFAGTVTLGGFGLHPLILLIVVGIALQGLAECFLSPKFLEYASKQAPQGEVGLYLGYQHLTTFFAWLAGFLAAGFLLDAFCPDPRKLDAETRHEWRLATDATYRYTLDESQRADLGDQIPVPTSIQRALQEHGLPLPADARLAMAEAKDAWKHDPERRWSIEVPLVTVQEKWSGGRPRWPLWRHPDGLSATLDGPRWADAEGGVARRFELGMPAWKDLGDGVAVAPELRAAFAGHGVDLPEDARVRKVPSAEGFQGTWKIVIRLYTIGESKLEADADARSAGRDRALRDVLLLAEVPRPAGEIPPLPEEYRNAHHIWYAFTLVGFSSFVALLVFKFVTAAIDKRRAAAGGASSGT